MKMPKEPIKNFSLPTLPDEFIFNGKMITVSDDLFGSTAEIPLSLILDKLSSVPENNRENVYLHVSSTTDVDGVPEIDGFYLKYKVPDPHFNKKYEKYLKELEKYKEKQIKHEEKYAQYKKDLEEYNKFKKNSTLEELEKQKLILEKRINKLKKNK